MHRVAGASAVRNQMWVNWFIISAWKYVEWRFSRTLRFSTNFKDIRLFCESARRTGIINIRDFLSILVDILVWTCSPCIGWLWFCPFLLLVSFTLINGIGVPFIWWGLFQYYILIFRKRKTVRMPVYANFALRLVGINCCVCTSWSKPRHAILIACVSRSRLVCVDVFLFINCCWLKLRLLYFLLWQSNLTIHKVSCQLWLHIP